MDAVIDIAGQRGLEVVEDAAHAPGAAVGGQMSGTIGRVGCFSFFSNMNLPIGEGGVVVTDDAEAAERMRLLRSHGMTSLTSGSAPGHAHSYDVVISGFNYRLDEVRAAVGLVQLERLKAGNAARARLVARYRALLEGVDGLRMPLPARTRLRRITWRSSSCPWSHAVRRKESMRRRGIPTSVHYPPIHRFAAYAEVAGARRELPETDALAERVLTLALYPHLQDDQVDDVAQALQEALATEAPSRLSSIPRQYALNRVPASSGPARRTLAGLGAVILPLGVFAAVAVIATHGRGMAWDIHTLRFAERPYEATYVDPSTHSSEPASF